MQILHIARLCTHFTLVCVALVLVGTNGYRGTPGLVAMSYANTEWNNSTSYTDWRTNRLPTPVMVALPGDAIMLSVWFGVTGIMVINDLLCCGLIWQDRWYLEDNHIDMGWHTTACVGLPMLFLCVASLLGSHDVVVLSLIAVVTGFSSLCGLLLEEVLTYTNTCSIDGLLNNMVFLLRAAQHIALIIAAEVVLIPVFVNAAMQNETINGSQLLLVFLFSALVCTLGTTSFFHHRACYKLELAYPNDTSMVPWAAPGTSPPGTPAHTRQHTEQYADEVLVVPGDSTTDCVTVTAVLTRHAPSPRLCYPTVPGATIVQDDNNTRSRKTIGENTEWRRYYAVTIFINALLATILLHITGVIGRS